MKRILSCTAIAAIAAVLCAAWAHAGGMQLSTRGVRATARGGALVAGASGLDSLGLNPAGLARLARSGQERTLLLDLSYVGQSARYQRIDSGFNPHDPVDNEASGLPIPTLGVSFALSDRAILAAGVYAPYAALGRYPELGPQRYSLVDLSESLLAITEVALGYQLTDRIRVGVGVQNMGVFMSASMVFSGCPAQLVCAPEDPEFDALGKVTQLSVLAPSGVVGAQLDVSDHLRLGVAAQLPFFIRGTGSFQTRLPSSGFFNGARVEGDRADVSFTWPAALRVGAELQPIEGVRIELAGSVEMWSLHDQFLIEPRDVRIEDAPGVGTYEVGPIRIPRHFRNTYALHLGVEAAPVPALPLAVLAGYSYETAAAPDEYLSVMTVDGDRHLVAAGVSYQIGVWQLRATAALVSVTDRTVHPDLGKAPQINPIRAEGNEVYVNWGDYASSWLVAGMGVSRGF